MKIGKDGLIIPIGWVITKSGKRFKNGQLVGEGEEIVECHPLTAKAIHFKAPAVEPAKKVKP